MNERPSQPTRIVEEYSETFPGKKLNFRTFACENFEPPASVPVGRLIKWLNFHETHACNRSFRLIPANRKSVG